MKHFRYCGEYFDEETGLTYLRNRYYDPSIGAFINEDPIRDGLNWYVYCSGNPVAFVDPWGLNGERASYYGRDVSEGAYIYLKYYDNELRELVQEYLDKNNGVFDDEFNKQADEIKAKIDEIYALDVEGKIDGELLDVPVYNQLNTEPKDNSNNLCWAACTAMVTSYYLGDTTDRTLNIATKVANSEKINDYNVPREWASTSQFGTKVSQEQNPGVLTEIGIKNNIEAGHPFGVLYNDGKTGHWIVLKGYAKISNNKEGIIVSNDPFGGIQRMQTYNNFQSHEKRPWVQTAY